MNVFLFDIDGTLIQSGGAGREAIDVALREAFDIDTSNDIDLGGRTDRGIAGELFALHRIDATDENWSRFQSAYLDALPERLSERRGSVLPGVEALLDALANEGETHLGLLTGNVYHGAQIKLSHFELWERFSFGGYGDRHAQRDDVAREAQLAARNKLNRDVPADRFSVIGDTVHDVRCARAIGAKSIAVCTGSATRDQLEAECPDVLLADLAGDNQWWR